MELTVYAGPACSWVFGRLRFSVYPDISIPSLYVLFLPDLDTDLDMGGLLVLRVQPSMKLCYSYSCPQPVPNSVPHLREIMGFITYHQDTHWLLHLILNPCISPYLSSVTQWCSVTADQLHSLIFPSYLKHQRVRPCNLGWPCSPVMARYELAGRGEYVWC